MFPRSHLLIGEKHLTDHPEWLYFVREAQRQSLRFVTPWGTQRRPGGEQSPCTPAASAPLSRASTFDAVPAGTRGPDCAMPGTLPARATDGTQQQARVTVLLQPSPKIRPRHQTTSPPQTTTPPRTCPISGLLGRPRRRPQHRPVSAATAVRCPGIRWGESISWRFGRTSNHRSSRMRHARALHACALADITHRTQLAAGCKTGFPKVHGIIPSA
jgi:hypothetical protein